MADAVNQGDYLLADIRYHEMMVSATHNDHLIQLTAAFTSALQAGLQATIRNDREWSTFMNFSLPLHRAVLDAVLAHDGEAARTAMAELVERSRRDTVDGIPGNGTRRPRKSR
jgi:DNA-binding FadR family transcriptional regulator